MVLSWVARFIEFLKLFISHGVFFQTLTDLDSRYSIFLCGDKEKGRPILEIKNRIEKKLLFHISSMTKDIGLKTEIVTNYYVPLIAVLQWVQFFFMK